MLKKKIFPRNITRKQSQDTGMALVLLGFIVGYFTNEVFFYYIFMGIHVVNMIAPNVYKPAAFVWLGFSNLLGLVVSNLLLTVVYIVFVVPMGTFRKLIGIDNLKLKKWGSSPTTVFTKRNHLYTSRDLEKPY